MGKYIKIVCCGMIWLDSTSDKPIGDGKELIEYVNKNRIVVDNDDCFLDASLFWYNQEMN